MYKCHRCRIIGWQIHQMKEQTHLVPETSSRRKNRADLIGSCASQSGRRRRCRCLRRSSTAAGVEGSAVDGETINKDGDLINRNGCLTQGHWTAHLTYIRKGWRDRQSRGLNQDLFFRVVVSAPSILLQDSLPISMTQGVLMLFGVLNKRFRGSPRTRFSTDSQHLIKNDDELQWFVAVWDFCASTVTLRVSRADFANGRDAICFTARRQCDRWY